MKYKKEIDKAIFEAIKIGHKKEQLTYLEAILSYELSEVDKRFHDFKREVRKLLNDNNVDQIKFKIGRDCKHEALSVDFFINDVYYKEFNYK